MMSTSKPPLKDSPYTEKRLCAYVQKKLIVSVSCDKTVDLRAKLVLNQRALENNAVFARSQKKSDVMATTGYRKLQSQKSETFSASKLQLQAVVTDQDGVANTVRNDCRKAAPDSKSKSRAPEPDINLVSKVPESTCDKLQRQTNHKIQVLPYNLVSQK